MRGKGKAMIAYMEKGLQLVAVAALLAGGVVVAIFYGVYMYAT